MTELKTLRIATRKSPLALWQAQYVKQLLHVHHPDLTVELVPLTSKGDVLLDVPLAKVGGKGLFVKELEQALLTQEADIAVHSMKDVPMDFPEGLGLAVICEREDPRDAWVSNDYSGIDQLPAGSVVGTSSLRRQSQLLAARPDLKVKFLRGNVQTRLSKLDAGEYHGIILAAAGLLRLEMPTRIRAFLEPEQSLPAAGQGAVGIECRLDDKLILELIKPLHHLPTAAVVEAERALNKRLEGGCQVPIAAFALLQDGELWLRALVASEMGETVIYDELRGPKDQAQAIGTKLAERLLNAGADKILTSIYGRELG